MGQWIKTDREVPIYVNLDHILYLIMLQQTPEEGEVEYHVRGALSSAPKEEIIFKVCKTPEQAELYMKVLMDSKKLNSK